MAAVVYCICIVDVPDFDCPCVGTDAIDESFEAGATTTDGGPWE